jgi:uncharacterized protein (DUF305 family)
MPHGKRLWLFAILMVLAFATVLTGRAQDAQPHAAPADPAWSELMGSMQKMHAAMASVGQSSDGDLEFVRLMLPHHRAAIDMAKTQLMYGKDPQMRRLAQEIIADQQSEIELMQLWLKQHDPSLVKVK